MVHANESSEQRKNDPSPEEIRRRAAKIRSRWSHRVRESRRRFESPIWAVPIIAVSDLVLDATRDA